MRLSNDPLMRATDTTWGHFTAYFALFFGAFAALFGGLHLFQIIEARVGDVIGILFWGTLSVFSVRYALQHRPGT